MASSCKISSDICVLIGFSGGWASHAERISELLSWWKWLPGLLNPVSPPRALHIWNDLHVMFCQSPKMQIIIQPETANAWCRLNVLHNHKACGQLDSLLRWLLCFISTCSQDTKFVVNNFENFLNNKIQSRGKGKENVNIFIKNKNLLYVTYLIFSFWEVYLDYSSVLQTDN